MRKKKKSGLKIFWLIFLVLVLIAAYLLVFYLPSRVEKVFNKEADGSGIYQKVTYAYHLLRNQDSLKTPTDAGDTEIMFEIEQGASVEQICADLEEAEIVASSDTFCTYLIFFGLDRKIQSGVFRISPQMAGTEVADILTDPLMGDVPFNILPGWRLEEISLALPSSGIRVGPEAFLGYAFNPPEEVINFLNIKNVTTLEGFLFPGSYSIPRSINVEAFVMIFLEAFQQNVDATIREAFHYRGLSVVQGITMASIIERETKIDAEKAAIASVFYNRLAQGMRLETDPTVQYALGMDQTTKLFWKSPLSLDDLGVDSPYNTYLYDGFPPGPIANPGLASILAAAYPDETPYYYFRAACDGSGTHVFAETFEQHLLNACP